MPTRVLQDELVVCQGVHVVRYQTSRVSVEVSLMLPCI